MPMTYSYPGVYVEELPSGVRTITGASTSITAFVGRALRGPVNEPVRIQNYGEFERVFGGLWVESTMSYAVQHFFLNGGSEALIVRLVKDAAPATFTLPTVDGNGSSLALEAASAGAWGNNLRLSVDHNTRPAAEVEEDKLFNLTVQEIEPTSGEVRVSETFRNVSVDPSAARFVTKILEQESALLSVPEPYVGTFPEGRPKAIGDLNDLTTLVEPNGSGDNGYALDATQYSKQPGLQDAKEGIYALLRADMFNLLCLPPPERGGDMDVEVLAAALKLCRDERAVLIVDPPKDWSTVSKVSEALMGESPALSIARDDHAAVYFPRLKMADPLKENRIEEFVPCGVVAGIIARTDAQRGVWKAPAGQDATMLGVRGLAAHLTDGENGQLNPLGVNCLRSFPVIGSVVWGARTWNGADRLASEWKYLPVRRTALFIEETLYRSLHWVVFEPNDESLWAQIRLNVGAFMKGLFRQGAFQGRTPREAYFVKCDKETTTQNDINLGIVNILVGFAPLKPAEFVVVKVQQIASQIAV